MPIISSSRLAAAKLAEMRMLSYLRVLTKEKRPVSSLKFYAARGTYVHACTLNRMPNKGRYRSGQPGQTVNLLA